MSFAKIIEAQEQVLIFKDPEPLEGKYILWRMVSLDGKLKGKIIEFDTEDERETYFNDFSEEQATEYLNTFHVEPGETLEPCISPK